MFKQVTIIGPGLLGASLVLAIRKKHLAEKIVVWARSDKSAQDALDQLPVDRVEKNPSASVEGSNFVILCTPVETINSILSSIVGELKQGCLVTDVGSVKCRVCGEASDLFKNRNACFIGSHPMAGSEKSGMAHASENLFKNRPCIITPEDEESSEQIKVLKLFWEKLGMQNIIMTPEIHDRQLSNISHLPHLISSTLAHSLSEKTDDARSMCGQGLRDTVRIAGGSPELWTGIIQQNQANVLSSLEKFQTSMEKVRSYISQNNFDGLREFLETGANFQKEINK